MADDERVAEDVFLGRLQGLHEDEVDREEAVDRDQEQEAAPPEPAPRPGCVHAASRSGGSKSRKSTSRAARRKGTSSSERAEAGPNCPAPIASQ